METSATLMRRYIGHARHALPVCQVETRLLLAPSELDAWVRIFPRPGEDLDALVARVMEEFRQIPVRTRRSRKTP